jgi:hypothetical protein
MEGFLVQHHEAVKMIPEVEQFMKLAREVLSSFPRVLLHNRPNERPSLYWVCLDLAMRLVKIDHQVSDGCMSEGTVVAFNRLVVSSMQIQEICDAACDFLLDAMHCQPGPIPRKDRPIRNRSPPCRAWLLGTEAGALSRTKSLGFSVPVSSCTADPSPDPR